MVEKVSGANENVMPTQVLRVARRTAYYVARARVDSRYHRATDAKVLEQIRAVRNSRAVRLPPRLGKWNGRTRGERRRRSSAMRDGSTSLIGISSEGRVRALQLRMPARRDASTVRRGRLQRL
jgi:hypothetical protein